MDLYETINDNLAYFTLDHDAGWRYGWNVMMVSSSYRQDRLHTYEDPSYTLTIL